MLTGVEPIRTWVSRYCNAPSASPTMPGLRQRVVNGVSWTLTGAVVGRIVSLVGIIVATRMLPASAFGQLSAVQLLVTASAGLAGLGLSVAVTKRIAEFRAREPERVWDYANTATRVVSVSGVIYHGRHVRRQRVACRLSGYTIRR